MPHRHLSPFDELIGELAVPTDWRTVPAADSAEQWDLLRRWVVWFKDRYCFDHRVVPPCWYLHPALVDVLTALRDHHAHAYDPSRPLNGPAEWQRGLRDLEPQLREWAVRTGCTPDLHRPDLTTIWPDDDARWTGHVTGDVTARTVHEAARPLE